MVEVEDFVDCLRAREEAQRLARDFAQAGEASFSAVWDNGEDAACDRI